MRLNNVSRLILGRYRFFKILIFSTMAVVILTLFFRHVVDKKIKILSTKVYHFQEINWEVIINHRKVSWFHRSDAEKIRTEMLSGAEILGRLSALFQQHLSSTQKSFLSCADVEVAIQCGVDHDCGFACNLHHHIGCMMLSYSLDMPLIQDTASHWLYHDPWQKYLKPIGSSCSNGTIGRIILWNWGDFADPENLSKFPLKNGLTIPTEFARLLKENHKNPFLWMVGQFAQHVFQPKDETLELIQNFKKLLKIEPRSNRALIGMHVRRTDKYKETSVILNSTDFMRVAMDFRKNYQKHHRDSEIIIFIASEDCGVIQEFRKSYSSADWRFVGWCEETLATPHERKDHLFDIIRDIYILTECDFVVCTHTSNICNLILELQSFGRFGHVPSNPENGVISLDGIYNLLLWHVRIINPTLDLI